MLLEYQYTYKYYGAHGIYYYVIIICNPVDYQYLNSNLSSAKLVLTVITPVCLKYNGYSTNTQNDLTVTDLSGRTIVNHTNFGSSTTIDNLQQGVYIISIISNQKLVNQQRIIKF